MTLDRVLFKAATAALLITLSAGASFAASDYVGKYKTEDTQGKPMEITLSENGAAAATREGETLTGKWKENKKGAAVIRWQDGWITKLSKKGDSYVKIAFEKGKRAEADKAEADKIE